MEVAVENLHIAGRSGLAPYAPPGLGRQFAPRIGWQRICPADWADIEALDHHVRHPAAGFYETDDGMA